MIKRFDSLFVPGNRGLTYHNEKGHFMKWGYLGSRLLFLLSVWALLGCSSMNARVTPAVRVVEKYSLLVVNIRTETVVDLKEDPEWGKYGEQLDSFLREYFGENYSDGTVKYKSIGSGVILNNEGLVVTNAHVIQKAKNIYVVFKDATVREAEVVALNPDDDLAIIRTALPRPVHEVRFADLNDIRIGETVIAIGNPFGLENSVTVGVISGKDRTFSSPNCRYECRELLQTDASINPGNSGGALLNLNGELVGINLAVVQNAQNIGFAVPANKAAKLLEGLK